ncbi:Transcription factor [Paramyrothecium foliicola]|nr:Transcription factor [Paramyrothecium foliicola]
MSQQSSSGIPTRTRMLTPYGQACIGCSKAKCKCALPNPRKRGGGRPPNRSAKIEERLEDLISLINSHSRSDGSSGDLEEVDNSQLALLAASKAPYEPAAIDALSRDIEGADPAKAEERLQLFRTTYLPIFPLAVIPPQTTAAHLRREKPFFWLAIQSVCSKPNSQRMILEEGFRRVFAETVLVRFERSLDLLLGLIVYSTWGFSASHSNQMFQMGAAMVTSFVEDLLLNKPPGTEPVSIRTVAYGPNASAESRTSEHGSSQLPQKFLRCTRIIYRLLLSDDPAWDVAIVQESVDLMATLQRAADICKAVAALKSCETDENDQHCVLASNLLSLQAIWTTALENARSSPSTVTTTLTNATTADTTESTISDSANHAVHGNENIRACEVAPQIVPDNVLSLDLFDDVWMRDVVLGTPLF